MKIQYKPYPKQFEALKYLTDDITSEILYGGGARGGKSYFGCAWQIIQRLSKPGSAGMIGRNELKRLKQTTLLTFFEVAKDMGLQQDNHFKYNGQDGLITFSNGSMIFLIDLSYQPSDPNYDRLGSYSITDLFIDEAQEISIQALNVLRGRFSLLEKKNDKGEILWTTIPKALYTCNPAKNWIYTDFYRPRKDGKLAKSRIFIPALVTDNPSIKPEYIEFLKQSDTVTVQRLLYGNFEYDDAYGKLFSTAEIYDMFTNNVSNTGEKALTCDVARFGNDDTVIRLRDGLVNYHTECHNGRDTEKTKQRIKDLEQEHGIRRSRIVIDEDGIGGGIVDGLRGCSGFVNNSKPIQPPEAKLDKSKELNYFNLKTQCYFKLQELLRQGKLKCCDQGKDKEDLILELENVFQKNLDKDSKIQLESKEEIKLRIGRSPDRADSLMLRMLLEVKEMENEDIYTPVITIEWDGGY